jgi:hypothetical protein
MTSTLVDPEVTREKVNRELELWQANSAHHERGWLLLDFDETLPSIELAFLSRVSTNSGGNPLPVCVCAIRLSYENYDLWPPSLTFIDVFSRQPAKPHVQAFQSTTEGPRNILIDAHPTTKQPFLCLPGIREYHSHPQHSGDAWLLHRAAREGSLSTICERIWRFMARNVVGLSVSIQTLPVWPMQARLVIQLAQGDVDSAAAQVLKSQQAKR